MERISRWGIGPVFAVLSLLYGLITIIISSYFYPRFQIEIVPGSVLIGVGFAFIAVGVPFFIASARGVMRAYNADRLITGGTFRFCRHPLYASWAVFIVPGIVLAYQSWIGLTTPVFMYIIMRILVKKEETYLENRFGAEYANYRARVPCILPYGVLFGVKPPWPEKPGTGRQITT